MSAFPKLDTEVTFRRLASSEETYVIVRDSRNRMYYKFEDWEYDILSRLDGTRNLEKLTEEFQRVHPEKGVDRQWMVDYLEGLRQLSLLERSEQERHLIMMDKLKTLRRKRFYDTERSTLFQIQIPLFDPDRIMNRTMPWIRWIWSGWFVAAWMAVFVVVLGFLLRHWNLYWTGFFRLMDFPRESPWKVAEIVVLFFGMGIWHELGHGFTCKRFGGEVHDIGFMIFYFSPAFYCNVDDSYLFPERSHRLFATFGGPYFELMLCSGATALWLWTPAEWWIHERALTLVFITGLSAVAFNLNPLIKLDGYYVLMDWLDVPDLREESFRYLRDRLKRLLFHLEIPSRPISRRRRRIYWLYGLCSILYTGTVVLVVLLFVRRWLVDTLGPAGYVALFGLLGFLFRRRLADFGHFVAFLWTDKKEMLRTPRRLALPALGFALLGFLLVVPRAATRVDATFTVEAGARTTVRAPAAGMVDRVWVREGDKVGAGQTLAILESPELDSARKVALTDFDRANREAASARGNADPALARQRAEESIEAKNRLALLDRRQQAMVLTAPSSGVVATPYLEEKAGRYLAAGEAFCEVDQLRTARLVLSASELEIEEIGEGTPVRLLLTAFPGRTLRASVLSLAPVADPPEEAGTPQMDLVRRAGQVRIRVEVDNRAGRLRPGMTGRAQFLTRPRSLLGKLEWRLRRWAASLLW